MPNKHFNLTPRTDATTPQKLKVGPQRVRVDDIGLRKHADTRPLNAKHVLDLAESIAVLDLLEPLVIDTEGNLLAGGHRLAAIQLLAIQDGKDRVKYFSNSITKDENSESSQAWERLEKRVEKLCVVPNRPKHFFDGVPVLVVDVRNAVASLSSRRALAIEVAENNVRRSYSATEIRDLADRLRKAGYKATPGRPKDGEVSAIAVLHAAVGKSKRTIERIIADKKPGTKSAWDNAQLGFKRAAQAILASGARHQSQDAVKLQDLAKKALAVLEHDGPK